MSKPTHDDVVAAFESWKARKGATTASLHRNALGQYTVLVAQEGRGEAMPFGIRGLIGASIIKRMRSDGEAPSALFAFSPSVVTLADEHTHSHAIAFSRTPAAGALVAASTPLAAMPEPRRIASPRDLRVVSGPVREG
jgi:hypothetical protein